MKSIHPIREAYMLRFGIQQTKRLYINLRSEVLMQLSMCKSEEARRLILGVSQ
jgi:hypothetical protein